jgi:PAS domain S-box-containing protein
MKIQIKHLILSLIVFLLFVGIAYIADVQIIGKVFTLVEQSFLNDKVKQVNDLLQNELLNLDTKIKDWSQWDDARNFVRGENTAKFIEANLPPETNINLVINDMLFYDIQKKPHFMLSVDLENNQAVENNLLENYISQNPDILDVSGDRMSKSGFIRLGPDKYALISVRGITDSQGSEEPSGMIVFSRWIDKKLLTKLTALARDPVWVSEIDQSGVQPVTQESGSGVINGGKIITDISGRPAFHLQTSIPRDINRLGTDTQRNIILAVSAMGFLMIMIMLLMQQITVIMPIQSIAGNVKKITSSDQIQTLLPVKRTDEIGELSRDIGDMYKKVLYSADEMKKRSAEVTSVKNQLESQLTLVNHKNEELETTKTAMLNLLDDERVLEDAIKSERDRIKAIITSMGEGMCVVDKNYNILDINPAAIDMVKLSGQNYIGKNWANLVKIYHGDTLLSESERPLSIALSTKTHLAIGLEDNYYYERADGTRFPVGIDATPIVSDNESTGIVILFRDITREKQEKDIIEQTVRERTRELLEKNQALEAAKVQISEGWLEQQKEKAKLAASINSLTIGFVMTDASERIITMNSSAYQIFDLKEEILEMDVLETKLKSSVDLHALHLQCLNERRPIQSTNVLYDKKYLKIRLMPIFMPENSELIGTVILVEDITEARVLERSRDEFFSIASHELRTPLTAIRGNTSLIQDYYYDKLTDKDLKEMISDVHESSIRLIGIVNDFLDMSRLEQGRMKFNISAFDLPKIIGSSVKDLEPISAGKSIPILTEIPENLPQVTGDPDKIKEVLINLIGNALKFTEQGSVTVKAGISDQDCRKIRVSVIDSGRGISKENQILLFRKFQQAETNIMTRDATKGTGLGLYISKLMIESMNGSIYLEKSEENVGSTFTFTIPLA